MMFIIPAIIRNEYPHNSVIGWIGNVDFLFMWLGISFGMHAFPSDGDAKHLWKNSQDTWQNNPFIWISSPLVAIIVVANILKYFWIDYIYAAILYIITFILITTVIMVQTVPIVAAMPGYAYEKDHVIYGSPDGALYDYPMKFVVHQVLAKDNGADVGADRKTQSWPFDLRFTDSNDNALLYWIESDDGNIANIWVEIPYIPIAPGNTTIKLYYGKANNIDTGNASDIFLFYDNFSSSSLDKSKWPYNTGINASASDGILSVTWR